LSPGTERIVVPAKLAQPFLDLSPMTFGVIVPHRSIVDCFENFIPGVRFVQVKSLFEFGAAGLLLVFLKSDA